MAETVLKIGDKAPDFELAADDGEKVRLSNQRGKRVVVYFYPKDDTSGCTAQACGFRDNYLAIEEKQALVLGISPDEAYGVWQEKSLYGKTYFGIVRSHFVVDEAGNLADIQVKVSPTDSVEKAIAALS